VQCSHSYVTISTRTSKYGCAIDNYI